MRWNNATTVSPKRRWESGAGVGVGMLRGRGFLVPWFSVSKFIGFKFLGFEVSWCQSCLVSKFQIKDLLDFHFMFLGRY